MLSSNVNIHDIYDMMEIKTIEILCLYESLYGNHLNYENTFRMLYYIVNTLNKNIKIVFDCLDKTLN